MRFIQALVFGLPVYLIIGCSDKAIPSNIVTNALSKDKSGTSAANIETSTSQDPAGKPENINPVSGNSSTLSGRHVSRNFKGPIKGKMGNQTKGETDLESGATSVSFQADPTVAFATRGIRGIRNVGNSCFISAALQLILHAAPLRQYLMTSALNIPRDLTTDLFSDLVNVFNDQWGDAYRPHEEIDISTTLYRSLLSSVPSSVFTRGQIGDSAEILSVILDRIGRINKGLVPNGPIHRIFNMKISRLVNDLCPYYSVPTDRHHTDISMPLSSLVSEIAPRLEDLVPHFGGKRITAETCIDLSLLLDVYVLHAQIDSGICKHCHESADVSHPQFEPIALPQVLMISITRREFMNPIQVTSEMDIYGRKYDLSGFVIYYGVHYIAYFKHPDTSVWYIADDSTVIKITGDPIVHSDHNYINSAKLQQLSPDRRIFMYTRRD